MLCEQRFMLPETITQNIESATKLGAGTLVQTCE